MSTLEEESRPPTSLEEHLNEALQKSKNDEARYHLREALQVMYCESTE
jgi:hypothetical protein